MAPIKRKRFGNLSARQKRRVLAEMHSSPRPTSSIICVNETGSCVPTQSELSNTASRSSQTSSDVPVEFQTNDVSSEGGSALDIQNHTHETFNETNNDTESLVSVETCPNAAVSNVSINKCMSNCSGKLVEHIKLWLAGEKAVSRSSVDRLLGELSTSFNVPSSVKTLETSTKFNVISMCDGQYVSIPNWRESINIFVKQSMTLPIQKVSLIINVDGINLFNSLSTSKYTAYPILVKVFQLPTKIFCAGIYCSNKFESKSMPPTDVFLKYFLDEFSELDQNVYSLSIFSCDAPVRAALKNINLHSGYNSCERCVQHGLTIRNTIVYPSTSGRLRTDESFNSRCDPSHHKSFTHNILELHSFPMVSGFIIDEMHCIYLGVVKRILRRLFDPKVKDKTARLSLRNKESFNNKLNRFQKFVPIEFNRKLEGGVNLILKWKASQYRLFALYISIVVFSFSEIVSKNIYANFLKLSIALRLLNTDDQLNNIEFIKILLTSFVSESQTIYGETFPCYNVHACHHLPDDYVRFGTLHQLSTFSFESYLGSQVKGAVRAGYRPLIQVCEHVTRQNFKVTGPKCPTKNIRKSKRVCNHDSTGTCLVKFQFLKTILKTKQASWKDSFVLTNAGVIGQVESMHDLNSHIDIELNAFLNVSDFFKYPLPSSQIGIYKIDVSNGKKFLKVAHTEILHKLFVLPYVDNIYVVIPLLHMLN